MRLHAAFAAVLPVAVSLLTASAAEVMHDSAETCAMCHSRVRGAAYPFWRTSMKSYAAVDPFWREQVAREVEARPADRRAIEAKCSSCHSAAKIEAEGVTCTVCHQITADAKPGELKLNTEQEIYGPHEDPFEMPMRHHTDFVPVVGKHMLEASLCGTCHTLVTGAGFVEQSPYPEWLASEYGRANRTCQSCHMPLLGGSEYIAHRPRGGPFPPTDPRAPVRRHVFVGPNYDVAAKLGLKETEARAREFVKSAASLRAESVHSNGRMRVVVTVTNLVGHKLPTGYPSRVVWLHLTARDPAGRVVFESGAAVPAVAEPHRDVIREAREVMVWSADYGGGTLLGAERYVKDNRILPAGFRQTRGAWHIAPVGTESDHNFAPGSDRVTYEFAAPRGSTAELELLYATGFSDTARPSVIARTTP